MPDARKTMLPYCRQSLDESDIQAAIEVLRSDWLTTGPKVDEFEEAFAAKVDAEFAVSFSSGTAALHGCTYAAGLKPGDRAVTTPMTFCATANAVCYQGSVPKFYDVQDDTLNLDPDKLRIPARAKAIIPVDFAGHPADLDEIMDIARRYKLVVIEDAAHALGAWYKNRPVGGICDMTAFSFHPAKHITTGEGGMVTTNDKKLASKLRQFRNHGIDVDSRTRQASNSWYYEMTDLGYNYRLSDISCAIGLSQLSKLDKFVARRTAIASTYNSALRNIPGLILPTVRDFVTHAWHLYPIRVVAGLDRDTIFKRLRSYNIGVNVHYIPVHLHPYYAKRGWRIGDFPVAEAAYGSLISLPMFPGMTDNDVLDVIRSVMFVFGHTN